MELHVVLRELVDRMGPEVFGDSVTVRGVLDDVLDERVASVGDVNLLVDAVRLGALAYLARVLATGAGTSEAVRVVGAQLARDRGGADPRASSWACAVLGYALGMVPDSAVQDFAPLHPSAAAAETVKPPLELDRGAETLAAPHGSSPITERGVAAGQGRTLVVIVVVVMLAVVIGAGGAYFLMDARRGTASQGPGTPQAPPSSEQSFAEARDPSSPGASATSSSQTPVRRSANALCWDGAKVTALAECSYPSGVRGLQWIFPDAADSECGAIAREHNGKVVDRYCMVALDGGNAAEFHYSQWGDFDQMRFNYRADQVGPDLVTDRADLHVFGVFDSDAPYKLVVFYRLPDAPWSATIYADTETDMSSALSLMQVRPVKQLRGIGRQQQFIPGSFSVGLVPAQ